MFLAFLGPPPTYSEVPNKSVTFLILFLEFFPTYMALLGPTHGY